MLKGIKQKDLQKILLNKNLRQRLAYEDPLWFSLIYLKHCFGYPLAPFHLEMFHLIKDPKCEFIAVMAFRESGKSTIMNTTNALWSILGKPQKKFVVIVSQTQDQAKNHFTNIKEELLYNELLREDFGPFADDESAWQKMSLELEYNEAKILSVSREQSIRGIKYNSIRPELIICDDLEDSLAKFDKAKRDEIYNRFVSEITPLGSDHTRIVVLGNLICEESLLMQLMHSVEGKKIQGIFRAYPIIDNNRKILWPEKFTDIEKIKELQKRFSRGVWAREFLLKLLGYDDNEPGPVVILMPQLLIDRNSPNNKAGLLPCQQAVIPQMEEYNILLPRLSLPMMIASHKNERYQQLYGNVDLDEPFVTTEEVKEEERRLTEEWRKWEEEHCKK